MRDRDLWLRRSNELIGICDAVRERFYKNVDDDTIGLIVSVMLLKGVRTFRAIRLLYMKELEEQAQALVRVLFETMVDLKMFMLKCSEDAEDAIRRVRDSMMLQKVKQARATGWAGFGLFGLDRQAFLDDEAEIKARYTAREVNAMCTYGFSALPLKERADKVQASEAYNIIYRNFSRNVHSTDFVEHIRMLRQEHESEWMNYKELRDAVGFSGAAAFLWEMAYTATIIRRQDDLPKVLMLIKLDRMAVKFRSIPSWVDWGPVADEIKALDQRLSGVAISEPHSREHG